MPPDYIVSGFASPKAKCEVRLDFSVGGEAVLGREDVQERKDRPARRELLQGWEAPRKRRQPGGGGGAPDSGHGPGGFQKHDLRSAERPPHPP